MVTAHQADVYTTLKSKKAEIGLLVCFGGYPVSDQVYPVVGQR
jgi:hypothetical protein